MSYRFNDAGVRSAFYEALSEAPQSWVDSVAWAVSSNHSLETYSMAGFPPALREWIGDKVFNPIREDTIIVRNKPFEATIEIYDEEIRRGESDAILVRIQELADRAAAHKGKLLADFMVASSETGSITAYDGQNFFDTDHSTGASGTQDNDRTFAAATGTTPTVAEMRDAIMASIQAILSFKDDVGEPMNENARNFLIMVPNLYWAQAMSAVGLQVIDTGVTNILANLDGFNLRVVSNARLTYTTKFATFRTDGRVKPFIMQEEVPVQLSNLTEGSDTNFLNRNRLYSATWWGGVHFGLWQHGCMTTIT